MRTISVINLKGGVGKTTAVINMAYVLAKVHHKKVLVIDNDKQGNLTKFYNMEKYKNVDHFYSISNILNDTYSNQTFKTINCTDYSNIDIISCDLKMIETLTNLTLSKDAQFNKLSKALEQISNNYDYCIIDNPPDLNLAVLNALCATDDIIVPIRADKFSLDGLDIIKMYLPEIKQFNSKLIFRGCFFNMFQNNIANKSALEYYKGLGSEYPMFDTVIRNSVKVIETSYTNKPLLEHSPKCNTSKDYISFVEEYLKKL